MSGNAINFKVTLPTLALSHVISTLTSIESGDRADVFTCLNPTPN